MSLPGPATKKRKADPVDWDVSETPSFPTLVNQKAIKEHVRLCVFMAEKKTT